VSAATPQSYLKHLRERDYRYHVVGKDRVDLKAALHLLAQHYAVKTLLVDSGPTLNGVLIREGLIDQISLLVVPTLVGTNPLRLFDHLKEDMGLELVQQELIDSGSVWLHYHIVR
jgi:2,5-diamino-6-(ribosylamino)-4(3H)-pyrimidinone 5'-phosphate reductase